VKKDCVQLGLYINLFGGNICHFGGFLAMIFYNQYYDKAIPRNYDNYIIKTKLKPTWLGRMFKLKEKDGPSYRGGCTVWNECPSGAGCDSYTREWLYSIWRQLEWEKEDKKSL
jgi:hypothetical protein